MKIKKGLASPTDLLMIGLRVFEMTFILAVCATRRFLAGLTGRKGMFWADLLEKLGPTYTKIGQIAGMRRDILPEGLARSLSRLQDRSKHMRYAQVEKTLRSKFGTPGEIFSLVDPVPVASASVAQVHKGVLQLTGQIVAIKIRRRGLQRQIRCDYLVMTALGKLLKLSPAMRNVPLQETLDDLFRIILDQLDFAAEIQNNKRLQKIFEDDPMIKIPVVLEDYCSDEIIVMEFMDDLLRMESTTLSPSLKKVEIERGLHALYKMIFTFGFFHCDLHMGNIFVNRKGELVILDTGFMGNLKRKELEIFKTFFLSIVVNDGGRCTDILIDTAIWKSSDFDRRAFEDRIRLLIGECSGKHANLFEVSQFAMGLFDVQRKSGLKGSVDFNMAIVALLVYEGLIKAFFPELDFQRAAIPYLTKDDYFTRLSL